jgi:hypothetical protein
MFDVLSELNWIAIATGTVALSGLGFGSFAVVKFRHPIGWVCSHVQKLT